MSDVVTGFDREAALEEYEAIFRHSVTGLAVLDRDGRFVRVNEALGHFLGRDPAWLLGRRPAEVTVKEDQGVDATLERRLRHKEQVVRVHKRYLRPDGTIVHGLVSAVPLAAGGVRTLAQVEDVTERFRLEDELTRLATHDPLTGLPGRRLLLERLRQAVDRDGRCRSVAVLFVDLDAFKLVNDALGHAAGDAVLQEVARRFVGCMRPGDTIGRLAGDEFLVVAPDLHGEHDARLLAERLEEALTAPVPFEGDEIFVSCSVGLTYRDAGPAPLDDDPVQTLISDADTAMYEAKRHGKRRYEVFDAAMRSRAEERSRTAARVRAAVAEGALEVHYQPVVTLPDLSIIGVEAVVRVLDADGRLLLPGAFLEVAQQIGALPDLDAHVLQVATRQVQQWRSAHDLDLHLSVNAGAGQVLRSLAEQVATELAASGLPPDRLSVELTEQTFIDGLQAASDTLHRLVATGVHIAIDDFGTGWASLTYLRQFPVSAIKVDKSFVAGLPGSTEDGVIVRALAELARQLDLFCVVEGIETRAQLDVLLALLPDSRCFGQGYLFAPPLPAEELLPLLLSADPWPAARILHGDGRNRHSR